MKTIAGLVADYNDGNASSIPGGHKDMKWFVSGFCKALGMPSSARRSKVWKKYQTNNNLFILLSFLGENDNYDPCAEVWNDDDLSHEEASKKASEVTRRYAVKMGYKTTAEAKRFVNKANNKSCKGISDEEWDDIDEFFEEYTYGSND